MLLRWVLLLVTLALAACDNNPWPQGSAASNTLHSAVIENSPRHLDPVASYWQPDTPITYQVYEPLYGFHYLKRPFSLIPKAAQAVVTPRYVGQDGQTLPADAPAEAVAESVYDVPIKPGILFQPHPALARDEQGRYRYHHMRPGDLGPRTSPMQFEHMGTRELVAEDFVYGLKRHATTRITTPIASVFAEYVVGLADYIALVKAQDAKLTAGLRPSDLDKPFLDFRQWPLAGVSAPEKYVVRYRIKGKYPQWNYWLQMTFTAPVPWEADAFYAQPGMAEAGLSLDRWPVGTGAYMLTEFEQDRRHVLQRNPHYRGDTYPCEGEPGDREKGLLADCGKKLPFIDTLVSTVEREGVPQRAKFRQGFYDVEVFERVDTGMNYIVEAQDSAEVAADYAAKGFRLDRGSDTSSYFIAFNMLDPVVGYGANPAQDAKNRKLRQALSLALDWEEWSRIFPKDAGQTGMSPLPPGIFGSREGTAQGLNPLTHRWVPDPPTGPKSPQGGQYVRRSLEEAKKLLAEAGYPNGRDAATGKPLVLNYDYYAPATPERKPKIDWVVRQFAKLDVQLEVRATDNNQFQDKVRKGKYQVFWLGWVADYPDAENFLFLLYGPAGKTKHDGENTSNYDNPQYNQLFRQMKVLPDGPEKQALVDQMVALVREDAPWTMGYYPYSAAATQRWVHNQKTSSMVLDRARYLRLDVQDRQRSLAAWNAPRLWPLLVLVALAGALVWGAWRLMRARERLDARGRPVALRERPTRAMGD